MTPAAKASPAPTLAEQLAKDPQAAVLDVLRAAPAALTASEIKRLLADRADTAVVEKVWKSAQKKIRYHDHVVFNRNTYQWIDTPRVVSAQEALHRIDRGGVPKDRRPELVETWRAVYAPSGSRPWSARLTEIARVRSSRFTTPRYVTPSLVVANVFGKRPSPYVVTPS